MPLRSLPDLRAIPTIPVGAEEFGQTRLGDSLEPVERLALIGNPFGVRFELTTATIFSASF